LALTHTYKIFKNSNASFYILIVFTNLKIKKLVLNNRAEKLFNELPIKIYKFKTHKSILWPARLFFKVLKVELKAIDGINACVIIIK